MNLPYANLPHQEKGHTPFSQHMLLRLIRKEDEEALNVEHLRANISPMETAGSSLATTHRIIKALFDFYTQEGCNYFVIEDKLTNQILLGIGLSTFAGLAF